MRRVTLAAAIAAMMAATIAAPAAAQTIEVVGDGIPKPLTATPGNAQRGKALVLARDPANCLDCHTVAKDRAMKGGDKGPPLDGVGAVLTPAQLRLTLVDFSRVNPKAVMPGFHRQAGKAGGEPLLTAQQIEDVVAYLTTLR